MGKWTPNYIDDVLHAKMSTLVTGAIRRSAIEKEPTITYQNFVNELDTGDSFTTTVIDILVKELAERRTRPAADRRYISERTARNLRQLTGALNIYRARPRSYPVTRRPAEAYSALYPHDVIVEPDEDEDEFENLLENTLQPEGTQMSSSELYEAMAAYPRPRRNPTDSAGEDGLQVPPPLRSPSATTGINPWAVAPASSSVTGAAPITLRPTSTRRSVRSRTSDFSDFTRRHRSSLRASLAAQAQAETVTEPREDGWTSLRASSSSTTRRFFPMNRLRRVESLATPSWSENADASGDDDSILGFVNIEPASGTLVGSNNASTAWFRPPSPELEPTPSASRLVVAGAGEERVGVVPAHRLRRGGLRAPESMLSRHASPVVDLAGGSMPVEVAPETTTTGTEITLPSDPFGEPSAYPTPGSVENEPLT